MQKFLVTTLLFILSAPSWGCKDQSPERQWTRDELIRNTQTIVFVDVVSKTTSYQKTIYKFEIVRVIKGEARDDFELAFEFSHPKENHPYVETDFNNHKDPLFWKAGYSRLLLDEELCTPNYQFTVGKQYIIFKESLKHLSSAEMISASNDKWYRYILKKAAR